MKQHWWKALGVLLLLYTAIVGLLTPLAPALVHVSPDRIKPGTVEIDILGYNTTFKADAGTWAWLENGGDTICLRDLVVVDATHLKGTLEVPAGLREPMTDLKVVSFSDGDLALPEAFYTEGRGDGVVSSACSGVEASPVISFAFPNRAILNESIRNLFFHVPMWFTMMLLMTISVVFGIRSLGSGNADHDRASASAVKVGLVFAFLGLVTGSIWARATWGAWWTSDPQLNGAATVTLIYLAYLILRGSVAEPTKRARLAAVYNIFAFVLMIVFFMVLPRLTDSLHPGKGGNPGFSKYDLDDRLRMVFYPAVLGWMLLGTWMFQLRRRAARLNDRLDGTHAA